MQQDLKNCMEALKGGHIILIPVETGWVLACDSINDEAIKQMTGLTHSGNSSQVIVLADNVGRLQSYLNEVSDVVWDLFELSEKPLTIRLQGVRNLAPVLELNEFCAFRITKSEFANQLCMRFRRPIACIPLPDWKPGTNGNAVPGGVDYVACGDKKLVFASESVVQIGKGNLIQIIKE